MSSITRSFFEWLVPFLPKQLIAIVFINTMRSLRVSGNADEIIKMLYTESIVDLEAQLDA